MSNIVPKAPSLPALPEFFNKLKPVDTPELTFSKGLIGGWYHEKKLARMERVSDHEARIAENRLRVTKATGEAIIEALTFGRKYEITMARYDHEEKMMRFQQQMAEAQVGKTILECQILQMEVESQKLDHKIKLRNYKEILDDIEAEDRE
jgi:hypothetical protein